MADPHAADHRAHRVPEPARRSCRSARPPPRRQVRRYGADFEALRDDRMNEPVVPRDHGHRRLSTPPVPRSPPTCFAAGGITSRSPVPRTVSSHCRGERRPAGRLPVWHATRPTTSGAPRRRPPCARRVLTGSSSPAGRGTGLTTRARWVSTPWSSCTRTREKLRMTVPKSFAGLPLRRHRGRRGRAGPSRRTVAELPRGSTSSPSTAPSTSRGSTPSTPGRGSRRSSAGPTRRCTRPSRGRSGSTPGSPRPRSPTPSTAATSRPARRG